VGPQPGAELGQQRDRVRQHAGVGGPLRAAVVQPGTAAYPGPLQVYGGRLAVVGDVDRPQHRRAVGVRQQARRLFAEDLRVQRHLAVRQVHRLSPAPRLGRQLPVRSHVGGDVGDGVVDAVAAARPPRQVDRLVQVHGAGGVQGDERDVGAVDVGQCPAGGLLGLPLRRGREPRGQLQLAAQRREVDAGRV